MDAIDQDQTVVVQPSRGAKGVEFRDAQGFQQNQVQRVLVKADLGIGFRHPFPKGRAIAYMDVFGLEIDLALQEHIKGPVSVQSWFFVQASGYKTIDKGGVQPVLVGGFQQESKIWHNSKKHASGCFVHSSIREESSNQRSVLRSMASETSLRSMESRSISSPFSPGSANEFCSSNFLSSRPCMSFSNCLNS